jgi:hypothetical protein
MQDSQPNEEILQLLSETRISLTKLAKEQGVSTATVWRWTTRGIKGHILSCYSVGVKSFTTREAYARWISAINGHRFSDQSTPSVKHKGNSSAERELAAAGILD